MRLRPAFERYAHERTAFAMHSATATARRRTRSGRVTDPTEPDDSLTVNNVREIAATATKLETRPTGRTSVVKLTLCGILPASYSLGAPFASAVTVQPRAWFLVRRLSSILIQSVSYVVRVACGQKMFWTKLQTSVSVESWTPQRSDSTIR